MADENANPNLADNIFMISQKSLDQLQKQIKNGEDISSDDIMDLTSPQGLADKDLVVPTDLRGISENFEEEFEDDFEVMLDRLGPKGTAEGLLKARAFFEANKANEPANKRAKTLTAKEWNELMAEAADDDDEDEEEEDQDEDEEEEDGDDDEEVE